MKGRGTMKTEILPQESSRAEAFSLWMSSPMPMVTLVKTLNVSHLLKMRKKSGIKFTSLMCWCIGRAASNIEEFYLLPENGKLFRFDKLVINVIVANRQGGINFCDIPFSDDLEQFNRDYLEFTQRAATECKSSFIEDCMIIGTGKILQPAGDVGQIPQRAFQNGHACIFPVPPRANGWRPCGEILGTVAGGNYKLR